MRWTITPAKTNCKVHFVYLQWLICFWLQWSKWAANQSIVKNGLSSIALEWRKCVLLGKCLAALPEGRRSLTVHTYYSTDMKQFVLHMFTNQVLWALCSITFRFLNHFLWHRDFFLFKSTSILSGSFDILSWNIAAVRFEIS